jgi:hypothetical protein
LRKLSAKESKAAEAAIRDVFEGGGAAWNRGELDGTWGATGLLIPLSGSRAALWSAAKKLSSQRTSSASSHLSKWAESL